MLLSHSPYNKPRVCVFIFIFVLGPYMPLVRCQLRAPVL